MTEESQATFFRQSGWVALATVLGGVFLIAVHIVATSQMGMDGPEYSVFVTLLRVQLLISVPAAGLQVMFASQTASATSPKELRQLTTSIRRIVFIIFILWLVFIAILAFAQSFNLDLLQLLKIQNPAAAWLTLVVGLVSLLLPALRGVLTGRQDFWGLGWSIVLDGVVRFALVMVAMMLGHQAAGGMAGVLAGILTALALTWWLLRDLPWREREPIDWRPWVKRALPLAICPGVMVLMFSADVLFVQATFSDKQTFFYMPAATVGLALFLFVTPLATVMFPKLVSSRTRGKDTSALKLALGGTAILGGLAVTTLFLVPELPLWIIYFKNPVYWKSAPLVTKYIAALYPLLLANVLIGNLLAKERFGARPCIMLVILAMGYAGALIWQQPQLLEMVGNVTLAKNQLAPATQEAFLQIILTFGGFNIVILALSVGLTWWLTKTDQS